MSNRKHRATARALWALAWGLSFAWAPAASKAMISYDHPEQIFAPAAIDLLAGLLDSSTAPLPWECGTGIDFLPEGLLPDDDGGIVPLRETLAPIHPTISRHRMRQPAHHGRLQSVSMLAALGTPIVGAVVTSPYGWRQHPILKKRRFHKGVDFGAPEGTPVLAARDGVVEAAAWRGHYGYYVRIRHTGRLETAYAHLAWIDPAIKPGSTVRRGQVIAAVGETGWATGPHLYYEVIVDGRRINPLPVHRGQVSLKQSDSGFPKRSAQSG